MSTIGRKWPDTKLSTMPLLIRPNTLDFLDKGPLFNNLHVKNMRECERAYSMSIISMPCPLC